MKTCINSKCHDYECEFDNSLTSCPRCGNALEQVNNKPVNGPKRPRMRLRSILFVLLAIVAVALVGLVVFFALNRQIENTSGTTSGISQTTTTTHSEPSDYVVHVITLPPTYASAQSSETTS